MKTSNLYFHVYLAALLMLGAVPAKAADVKELFATDLPDYPGKEGRMIEVSYPPGAQDVVHRDDADAFGRRIRARVGLSACPTVTMLERIEPVNRVLHSPA